MKVNHCWFMVLSPQDLDSGGFYEARRWFDLCLVGTNLQETMSRVIYGSLQTKKGCKNRLLGNKYIMSNISGCMAVQ